MNEGFFVLWYSIGKARISAVLRIMQRGLSFVDFGTQGISARSC